MIEILSTADETLSREASLVLSSAGIQHSTSFRGGYFVLRVHPDDAPAAMTELADYLQENPDPEETPAPLPVQRARAWPGAAGYAIVIWIVFLLQSYGAFGFDWVTEGVTGRRPTVADGEWWRALTALTLHADFAHIVGNTFFGAVFGGLLAEGVGTGVAWSTITFAGFLGNLLNAVLKDAKIGSIGASTAVFGALGALAAWQWTLGRRVQQSWMRRWAPIVGAVVMLSYVGIGGERTDVLAHVTGLLAGLGLGLAHAKWTTRRAVAPELETALRIAPPAAVLVAWVLALQA